MEWKLFASTFALIFLAELGDKTQLAAFAATAGAKSPWSIFLGASAALVLSTLLAVLFGETIQRWVPQQYLKLGAGGLFVLFGVLLLFAGMRPVKAAAVIPSGDTQPALTGAVARMVLSMATEFEAATVENYDALASQTQDPGLAALLRSLAAEERSHLRSVRDTLSVHGPSTWPVGDMRPVETRRVAQSGLVESDSSKALAEAIAHEQATAAFYRELAARAPLASLKTAFAALAEQEDHHAERLIQFQSCVNQQSFHPEPP